MCYNDTRQEVKTLKKEITFPTMGSLVGEYGIEFTTRKGNLVNTDVSTDILFKKQPILRMSKLIPVKITAQMITVLTLQKSSVNTIQSAQ